MTTRTLPSDEQLLERITRRDEAAYEDFFRRHYSLVVNVLRDAFRLGEAAHDVAQETMLQIWRRAGSFDSGRGSVKSWLLMVARSRALDFIRSRQRLERNELAPALEMPASVPAASESGMVRTLWVQRGMEVLPQAQQTALRRAFFDGMSHSELAEFEGRPLGTVKTQIRSSLRQLKQNLSEAA